MRIAKIAGFLSVAVVGLCGLGSPHSFAQDAPKPARAISPIFSQLLMTGHPEGFGLGPAFEKTQGGSYIRESVLTGETVNDWSQMITVSAFKDVALRPDATPKAFLNNMAGGFKQVCPDSFAAQAVLDDKLAGGFDIFAGIMSCGVSRTKAGTTSETALVVVIKGQADFYVIQWAEQAAPSNRPIPIDLAKWEQRFIKLRPIRLCPIVPGEPAPYPSCSAAG